MLQYPNYRRTTSYSITRNKVILAQKKHFKHRENHCSLSLNGKYEQLRCSDNEMYVSVLPPHKLIQEIGRAGKNVC